MFKNIDNSINDIHKAFKENDKERENDRMTY